MPSPEAPVAAVILAAGDAKRMGQLKQLLPFNGQPMVRRVTEAVCTAGLAQTVAVVGAQADDVQRALAGLPVEIIVNEAWREGMSTSLRAGLRALRPDIRAVLVVLADQPALTPTLLRVLVDRYRATGAPLIAPFYHGRRGNPVLFDRSLLPELLAVTGDQGGREVIARHQEEMEQLKVDDPAVILDVDTAQDLEEAWGLHRP